MRDNCDSRKRDSKKSIKSISNAVIGDAGDAGHNPCFNKIMQSDMQSQKSISAVFWNPATRNYRIFLKWDVILSMHMRYMSFIRKVYNIQ